MYSVIWLYTFSSAIRRHPLRLKKSRSSYFIERWFFHKSVGFISTTWKQMDKKYWRMTVVNKEWTGSGMYANYYLHQKCPQHAGSNASSRWGAIQRQPQTRNFRNSFERCHRHIAQNAPQAPGECHILSWAGIVKIRQVIHLKNWNSISRLAKVPRRQHTSVNALGGLSSRCPCWVSTLTLYDLILLVWTKMAPMADMSGLTGSNCRITG